MGNWKIENTHFQSFLFDFNIGCRGVISNNKRRILTPYPNNFCLLARTAESFKCHSNNLETIWI